MANIHHSHTRCDDCGERHTPGAMAECVAVLVQDRSALTEACAEKYTENARLREANVNLATMVETLTGERDRAIAAMRMPIHDHFALNEKTRRAKDAAERERDALAEQVCDECSPDAYGWKHNRVEGRHVCVCIAESEPYQLLLGERDALAARVAELERLIDKWFYDCDENYLNDYCTDFEKEIVLLCRAALSPAPAEDTFHIEGGKVSEEDVAFLDSISPAPAEPPLCRDCKGRHHYGETCGGPAEPEEPGGDSCALRASRAAYAAGLRDAVAALDYEVETYSRTVDGLSFPRLRAAILAAIPEEAADAD